MIILLWQEKWLTKSYKYKRNDYGIETFFEKEVMILLSWKQWTESNRENSVALFYCEGGYMCYNKTN